MAVASAEPIGTRFKAMFRPSTRARDSRRGRVPTESREVELLQDLAPTIESLFRPSTRFRDSHRNRRNRRGRLPKGWSEVELLQDLALEDVLATGITWEDYCLFLKNKVVWMTPDAYVVCARTASNTDDPEVLWLRADANGSPSFPVRVHVRAGTAVAAATATCDFLLRILATCEKDGVFISNDSRAVILPLSGAGLTRFFQESRSCLRRVTLNHMDLSEDLCLALATMSRLDVALKMTRCTPTDDAAGAFVECLQSAGRGPINLYECTLDSQILANALTGNSRVTRLKPRTTFETSNADTAVIFRALAKDKSLVDLNLRDHSISDENWTILCESLQAHPILTSLKLTYTRPRVLNDEERAQRTRVLAEMVQRNTSLHTIKLSTDERDQQIYAARVQPYLETNQYRPRVLAITKAAIPLRRPLLGLALQTKTFRNNSNIKSNLLWMFLSTNPDVVVLDRTKMVSKVRPVDECSSYV
jgi:hypothetical protein